MRLRNKKTGEIGDFNIECLKDRGNYLLLTRNDVPYYDIKKENGNLLSYDTLAELNEEWKDYKQAEPLIKDEKVRKAVRAWAEAVGKEETFVASYNVDYHDCCIYIAGLSSTAMIDLGIDLNISEGSYTITELCGEEEE